MLSGSLVHVDDVIDDKKLECLVDLHYDIFIDDWTNEGIEFGANFIDKVTEPEDDIEEGEIQGETRESVQETWAERRKKWWKIVLDIPLKPVLKTKFVFKGEATGRIVS
ncbi:hypothetical protein L1987_06493 [Smallanthus sonchifolius]|uniref:Uncharacterized protein n=1 Tax=Smallanthus sonchifolius TaxID=185202 RepID=A0ACB9JYI3_9ASTR|nr:hypothetical protein L1987_06493 [Smallanthus sonchifolius]